jgi:hypothetical protein
MLVGWVHADSNGEITIGSRFKQEQYYSNSNEKFINHGFVVSKNKNYD